MSLADTLDSHGHERDVPENVLSKWRENRDPHDGGLQLGLDGKHVDSSELLKRLFGSQSGRENSESSERPNVSEQNLQGLLQMINEADLANWNYNTRMSAEIDALRAHDIDLDNDDLVLLLASDSTQGLANAIWNALILARGDHKRVWYRDSLNHVTPDAGARQQVVIMRIPHLDVETNSQFQSALESLTDLAELIQGHGVPDDENPVRDGDELVFHITGGYRSTLPYLIAIAEWLRSLRSEVSAQLLPKKGGETMSLPLRKLDPNDVKDELSAFAGGSWSRKGPQTRMLLGYAYTKTRGGFELNELGKCMRTLFIPEG
ncbi:hypothetical protein IDM40_26240 [Nocardiopsis sp. HNM0947]|uniref:Uncharacterized protein n=1 Tax=Nocardiopsis coralli TaxID=2772213 RepID=A0ABR9PE94_9ACTN|nr:hypothetical protein [Nocardiopsis coralli]